MTEPAAGDADERLMGVVHDLRTPLAIAHGFADLLQRRGDALSAAERAEYVERIVEATAEMRDLLDAVSGSGPPAAG